MIINYKIFTWFHDMSMFFKQDVFLKKSQMSLSILNTCIYNVIYFCHTSFDRGIVVNESFLGNAGLAGSAASSIFVLCSSSGSSSLTALCKAWTCIWRNSSHSCVMVCWTWDATWLASCSCVIISRDWPALKVVSSRDKNDLNSDISFSNFSDTERSTIQ